MTECIRCNRALGFLSSKHQTEVGILCGRCFGTWRDEIMLGFAKTYLADKTPQSLYYIQNISADYGAFLRKRSVELLRRHVHSLLSESRRSPQVGLQSDQIDGLIQRTSSYETVLDFLDDLEKLLNLFRGKGVATNFRELISLFSDLAHDGVNQEMDKVVKPAYRMIAKKLGGTADPKLMVQEFMELDFTPDEKMYISRFLTQFGLRFEGKALERLIEEARGEVELRRFEKRLGRQSLPAIGDIDDLDGYEFEAYLKKLFRVQGYDVLQTPLSRDQGADLICAKAGEKTVVQAKRYTGRVSNRAIQEVVAARGYYGADRAMVVTTSSFTADAIELAISNEVELWDGDRLKELISDLTMGESKWQSRQQITVAYTEGQDTYRVKVPCVYCKEESFHLLSPSQAGRLRVECPNCGGGMELESANMTWTCPLCSKAFDSRDGFDKHEGTCEMRPEEL